jgi:hypothetical protein
MAPLWQCVIDDTRLLLASAAGASATFSAHSGCRQYPTRADFTVTTINECMAQFAVT